MSAQKFGKVKWFREDGTGYIISDDLPDQSLFVDTSVIARKRGSSEPVGLKKGQKVKFKEKFVLGRKVAVDVEPA